MIIEKGWKPSGTKANARYRGVTELSQYSNFVLETAHDLNLLSHLLTGNEKTNVVGHEKAIDDNHLALFNGGNPVYYNSFTASTICKVNRDRKVTTPTLDKWESVGGCVVSKVGTGYRLSSNGTLDPCGVRTGIFVMPGDIIFLRLKVNTAISGTVDGFTFGSENVNNGTGSLKKLSFTKTNDGFFVDYRLYCTSQETIFLNLYVHKQPTTLKAQSVDVLSVECFYAEETKVGVKPLNGEMKQDLNQSREVINFLKK